MTWDKRHYPWDGQASRGCVAIAVITLGYMAWMAISILTVMDPVGFGGIQWPDGLEGIGVVVGILAFPVYVTCASAIYLSGVARKARCRRAQGARVVPPDPWVLAGLSLSSMFVSTFTFVFL